MPRKRIDFNNIYHLIIDIITYISDIEEVSCCQSKNLRILILLNEQDKSSDIEQQPPFDDRIYSNTLPQMRKGATKPTRIY